MISLGFKLYSYFQSTNPRLEGNIETQETPSQLKTQKVSKNSLENRNMVQSNQLIHKQAKPISLEEDMYTDMQKMFKEAYPLDSAIQVPEAYEMLNYEELKGSFNQLCEELQTSYLENNSAFNFHLRQAEKQLIQMKELSQDPLINELEMEEMQKKFDELYCKIPKGTSLLFQKDIDKMKQLYALPSDKTYKLGMETFYEPNVTVNDFSIYFQEFCQKWGFSGISVNMKTRTYYDDSYEQMITIITFLKNDSIHFSIPTEGNIGVLFKTFFPYKEDVNRRKNEEKKLELRQLVDMQNELWGFEKNFEIGDVNESFSHLQLDGLEKFGLYIILYHRKVTL